MRGWPARLVRPLIIVAGVNVAVFAAVTLPRLLQERSLASRESVLRAEVDLERRRLDEARQRVDVLRRNADDTARFYREVVGDRHAGLVPTLQEVSATAEGIGLKVAQQRYTRARVQGLPLERFRITLPVTGSYAQLASLVAAIEHLARFVTVDEVALNEDASTGQGTLGIGLSVYFRSSDDAPR
jgi:Tfp pilus assembly protein PilO